MNEKVLVFDSGRGGKYVAIEARKRFPDIQFDFVADTSGLPYGNKTSAEIIQSAATVLEPLVTNYDFVIIACHTLTEVGIGKLREQFPATTFIGFDPGIKKAHDKGYDRVCVLATPTSLSSDRYNSIKSSLEINEVCEPDCSTWAEAIEADSFDTQTLLDVVDSYNAPCVVLACTHYFWLENDLKALRPELEIINPTQAVLDQFERLLTASRN